MSSANDFKSQKIHFEQAKPQHKETIFQWLSSPHMQEFWDNSHEHKDDILNFMYGRKQHYFYGTTQYWVGYYYNNPFAFILSDQILTSQEDISELQQSNLSKDGHTIALDFGIGNLAMLGKGLAALTLKAFVNFYHSEVDPKADTFFIDPDKNNPRAVHVYEKAGFKIVGSYAMPAGFFKGQETCLMVKKLCIEK